MANLKDENSFIAHIGRYLSTAGVAVPADSRQFVGIGDDAAVVRCAAGETLLYATDALVDGVHFRQAEILPFELGWKSIAVNQSDIAAMGGVPKYALITLGGVPFGDAEWCEAFYAGVAACLKQFGGICVGGDTVKAENMFVSVAFIGALPSNGLPLLRSSAKVGDAVCVTGALGGAAGWHKLQTDALRACQFQPTPRVAEGVILREAGVACAMDLSDGLIVDLERILAASDTAAEINVDSLPLNPALQKIKRTDALNLALTGGDDYELLFTCADSTLDELAKHCDYTRIGKIVPCEKDALRLRLFDSAGKKFVPHSKNWDNLAE